MSEEKNGESLMLVLAIVLILIGFMLIGLAVFFMLT